MAVTDPSLGARGGVTSFIVERDMPGVSVGTIEHKMGIRGSATSEMIFDEVCVPTANVLGQVGAGFVTFMETLDTGRLGLGAACVGGTRAHSSGCASMRPAASSSAARSARSKVFNL